MKMLCCCRRRGKYTTTAIELPSIKRRTPPKRPVVKIPVPVHEPTIPPQVEQEHRSSVSQPSVDKAISTQIENREENRESVNRTQENINQENPADKIISVQDENTKSVTITQEDDVKHSNSVEKTISIHKENRESINRTQENINQQNPADKIISVQDENTKSVTSTQEDDVTHSNSVEKTISIRKENRESINRTQEKINHENSVDKTISTQEKSTTSVIGTQEESETVTLRKNSQSTTTTKTGDSEDNMSRKKIIFDLNNDDIKGPVPLITPRNSLRYSNILVPEIIEEPEDIEIRDPQQPESITSHSKVTFGEVDYRQVEEDDNTNDIAQERREGIREAINVDTKTEIPKYPKSVEDVLHLRNAFSANDFLANVLKGESLHKVIDAMHERKVKAGEVIIQEGEPGNNMYVSMRGTYEIYVKNKLFATFSDKRVFGELAILYNSKRLATIKAVTNGKIWVLERHIYQQIIVQSAIQDFEETLSFLRNVPLVNKLNDESLTKISNLLQKEFFKTDTVIVREGEPGDKFYIIRAGSVTITKEKQGKVSELGRGAFFGERALLTDEPRQATVTADAPGVECLTLTSSEFKKHFNDLSLQSEDKSKDAEVKPVFPEVSGTTLPQNEFSHLQLDDLERRATLGVGGFGRVELVQHREDPKLTFALKYLKKIDMLQQEQVEHVFNERDIQISCNCIFIARMFKTFKDDKYLYFLMESCMGGDLWTYLQKQKGRSVPEMEARFYAGCVLEALSYLHERNIIYRDLKPENLLIDSKGYIKMTDFGFAKNLRLATKTYTFAGTPEYVAPEIIYNRGHDKSVDYWAFGILVFELLVGKTPFRTDDRTNMMTYNRILRGINSVTFPQSVTNSARNIIQRLCRPISIDRLGNQKNGIQDIRGHKWFQGFDWEKLRNKKMKAPFVPKLSSPIDTRYFEKFNDDDDIPPDEVTSFVNF